MKRKTIYAILAASTVMLSCTACGGQTDSTDITEQEIMPDTGENDLPEADSDTTGGQQHYHVTLDWQKLENNDTAEDGMLLYSGTCTYPVVYIEENQAAADNINASIQEHVTAFHDDTSIQGFARENYVPENPGFIAYNSDLSFAVRRSDSNVISFEAVFYVYSGGAHGN